MEEAILLKDLMSLREQDRLKNDIRILIEKKDLRTVVVPENVYNQD